MTTTQKTSLEAYELFKPKSSFDTNSPIERLSIFLRIGSGHIANMGFL